MPFNQFGDLYKREIVAILRERGFQVKDVHALNLILEEMGILKHYANGWATTAKGVVYTIYRGSVINADAWHASVIDEICNFLKK